jgi:hypothetical protein
MEAEVEIFERLRKVEMAQGTHEAVCAERYRAIVDQHSSIKADQAKTNNLLVTIGMALLGGMAFLLAHQVWR